MFIFSSGTESFSVGMKNRKFIFWKDKIRIFSGIDEPLSFSPQPLKQCHIETAKTKYLFCILVRHYFFLQNQNFFRKKYSRPPPKKMLNGLSLIWSDFDTYKIFINFSFVFHWVEWYLSNAHLKDNAPYLFPLTHFLIEL